MIKRAMAIAGLASMLPSAPAQAAHFVVSGSGSVTNLRSLSLQPITGAFADGDPFHVTVDADLVAATHWFDSDDGARAFYRVPVSFSLAVGSFGFSSSAVETLSISDDVRSLGYDIDSIYLLLLGLSAVNGTPSFGLGARRYVQSISVAFADLTGVSTNGTDLGQLRRTSLLGTPTFSYQLTGPGRIVGGSVRRLQGGAI